MPMRFSAASIHRTKSFVCRSRICLTVSSKLHAAAIPWTIHTSRTAPSLRNEVRRDQWAAASNSKPADALTETLGGISQLEGRVPRGNNLVLGGDTSLEKWRELDEKVNKYPGERSFKAIGSGGEDFRKNMVLAVQHATAVDDFPVSSRPSAKGNFISVTIGPVVVTHSDQVYASMRKDSRLKWYL